MLISGVFFFFFQAEDGIRDIGVTGVQTCALPICKGDKKQTGPPHMQTLLPSQGNHRLNAKTAQQLGVDVCKAHIGQGVKSQRYNQLTRLHKKKNKPMKTWAKDGHRDFSQEDLKRANRCMKTCSPSLSLRPRQIPTAMT